MEFKEHFVILVCTYLFSPMIRGCQRVHLYAKNPNFGLHIFEGLGVMGYLGLFYGHFGALCRHLMYLIPIW
jgi:hypothetical protein